MHHLSRFATVALLAGTAVAQSLVKDINSIATNLSSSPLTPVVVGGTAYFAANDGVNGTELWKTDGTTAGTVLVKDINPTALASSSISGITAYAAGVVFAATDGVAGIEIWKSDGTAAGTVMVADIYAGASSSSPAAFTVLGGSVYFFASDLTAVTGLGRELYKYDGATVSLVLDIQAGAASGISTSVMVNAAGTLFFPAVDVTATNNIELWKSDGTAAGTVLVSNINTTAGASSSPTTLAAFGAKVLFRATDGVTGIEPWVSDGTAGGTVLLKDCYPLASSSSPSIFIVNGAKAFFPATDSTATVGTGTELYVTDGTPAGTALITDLNPGTLSGTTTTTSAFAPLGAGCCFYGNTAATGIEVFYTDGTGAGTALIKDFNPGTGSSTPFPFFNHLGVVYIQLTDGLTGFELFKTDGTLAGSVLVKDIFPGSSSSSVTNFASLGATLLCTANDGTVGTELWKSDGTTAGTVLVKDINTTGVTPGSSAISGMTKLGTKAYFSANDGVNGAELWVTDGTAAGTTIVKDIFAGPSSSSPLNLTAYNGKLYFSAIDAAGREPWVSDGTAAGTVMLKDCAPGSLSSTAQFFTGSNNKVFFQATDGTATVGTGGELYVSDGTPAGTSLVVDLNPGTLAGFPSSNSITPFGTGVMFRGDNGTTGTEPFFSDGTAAGTTLVKDIFPGLSGSSPVPMKNIGGVVFMQAAGSTSTSDWELWKSDGTAAGTVLVLDINVGLTASSPTNFTAFGGKAYFTATNGSAVNGTELWVSDGTAAGTTMVSDINLGAASSSPTGLTVAGNALFFTALDVTNGRELWSSDGTGAGTLLAKDVFAGASSGASAAPFAIGAGKRVVFAATDGATGIEMYVSDGMAAGTTAVFDLNPGSLSSSPANYVVLGNNLLFSATTSVVGSELFSISLTTLGASEAEVFGVNCKGFGNPTIGTSGGAPYIGNASFAVTLASTVPTTPCALYLNSSRSDTPVSGCIIYPTLFPTISVSSTTDASGSASLALPIPNVPANIGVQLWFQWVAIDVGGPIFGLASASQGLRIRIGQS